MKWFGVALLVLSLLGGVVAARPITDRYRAWRASRVNLKTPYVELKPHLTARSESEILVLFSVLQKLTAGPAQDPKALTARDISESLRRNGVPEATVAKLLTALTAIESSMYRGTPLRDDTMRELVLSAQEISDWEKA